MDIPNSIRKRMACPRTPALSPNLPFPVTCPTAGTLAQALIEHLRDEYGYKKLYANMRETVDTIAEAIKDQPHPDDAVAGMKMPDGLTFTMVLEGDYWWVHCGDPDDNMAIRVDPAGTIGIPDDIPHKDGVWMYVRLLVAIGFIIGDLTESGMAALCVAYPAPGNVTLTPKEPK